MSQKQVRVLITGAGSGASGNLIRALWAMRRPPYIVGVNDDRFTLKQSLADRNYLGPSSDVGEYAQAMSAIVTRERLNVVMPTDDRVVKALSDGRDRFPVKLHLPSRAAVDLCQDKLALSVFLRRRGVPAPETYPVRSLRDIEKIFARFVGDGLLWCRARRGELSRGATAVAGAEQARAWITLWRDVGGANVSDFTLCEYLPGRHIMIQSVWRDGRLLGAQAVEVVSYFAGGSNPSGIFSMASLAKTVVAPAAMDVALRAVQAVEQHPSGAFDVELREGAGGVPCVTEINAGRFPAGFTTLLAAGPQNMVEVFALSAIGEPITVDEPHGSSEGLYLVRDIDATPGVFSTAQLVDEIGAIHSRTPSLSEPLAGSAKTRYKVSSERGRPLRVPPYRRRT